MPYPLSFAKTCDCLLQKSVTRRDWTEKRAKSFIHYFNEGSSIPALNKNRRYGGEQIGTLTLTAEPYLERLEDMPESDLAAEGFPEMSKQEFIDKFFAGNNKLLVWVIRFSFQPTEAFLANQTNQNVLKSVQLK